jgi:D-apiose dehydrogenase
MSELRTEHSREEVMNSHQRQRVALIGCGFFAPNHIHAWMGLDEAELVAVCDNDAERARQAAHLAGEVPFFTDAAEMLVAVTPDVVDIVTTAPSHPGLARLCAEYRTPAIIQKPLAPSFDEAVAIARIAQSSGIRMMVHENFRFQKPIRAVKQILDAGEIGEPRYCSVGFRCGYDIYQGQPYLRDEERLVLMDIGVHVFDVARFLMGEITELSCRAQKVRADVRGEDMATALVGFANGAMGLVEASWGSFLARDPFPETLISVEGTAGTVVLEQGYQLSVRAGDEVSFRSVEPEPPTWAERPWHVTQDSVVETCRHWLDVVQGRAVLETSVADNLKTLALIEASYLSAANRGEVTRVHNITL